MTEETKVTRDVHGRWLPGSSGNPSGRPQDSGGKLIRAAMDRRITPELAEQLAGKLLDLYLEGNVKAMSHLMRFYGLFEDKLNLGGAPVAWNWTPAEGGGQAPGEPEVGGPADSSQADGGQTAADGGQAAEDGETGTEG